MIVITLSDCPKALRGDLSLWLQEISTGVYVGQVSARVRDMLWERVQNNIKTGQATIVYSTNNEQRLGFHIYNTGRKIMDFDGLKLVLRPSPLHSQVQKEIKPGYSNAAKWHMAKQKNHPQRKPPLETYAVVDIETTGLNPRDDEIIEIGAIKITNGVISAQYQKLIKPLRTMPNNISVLTGITQDTLLKKGEALADVMPEFLHFIGNLPVVSHNASFDYAFLQNACRCCSLPLFSNPCVDTLSLARRLVKDAENFKLVTLAAHFGLKADHVHRSIADCIVTKQLYQKLIEIKKEEY